MQSSTSDLSSPRSQRADRIRRRFERDFLPRYGTLWRSMLSTTTTTMSSTSATSMDKKISSTITPTIQKTSTDFLEVIQTKRPTHIRVVQSGGLKQDEDGSCECQECQPPVLEELEEQRKPYDNITSEEESSTTSSDSADSYDESSVDEGTGPATPSPTDLESVFGRLTVGKQNGSSQNDVIDLVDTDEDEEVDGDRLVKTASHSDRNDEHDYLVDSSEDESSNNSVRVRGRVLRRRSLRKKQPLYTESDSDDSIEDATLSVFGDETDSSSEGNFGIGRRESISKLARPPTRLNQDDENWNPNRPVLSLRKITALATFKKNRDALSQQYFQQYDDAAFEGKLAGKVDITWSTKLRTTAGLTRLKRRQVDFTPGASVSRLATIELSTKVLDDTDRLASTLLHEMVHAAAWIIDNVSKPPHGACFQKWANHAMRRIPGSKITTTHDYQIEYKYAWACSNPDCKFLVKRHSRSVDVSRQCCGRCRGRLIEVEVPTSIHEAVQKTPKKRAPPSGYNLFVKEQSKAVREQLSRKASTTSGGIKKVSQAEVMKECARLWKERKGTTTTIEVE